MIKTSQKTFFKYISVGIIVVLLCIVQVSGSLILAPSDRNNHSIQIRGITIYVDDDGGADYTNIQDAIDNATSGDTIYVYNGTYKENIDINKQLILNGEDQYGAIVDGQQLDATIKITVDSVFLSNFTLTNSSSGESGIFVPTSYNEINNNIIISNRGVGIELYGTHNVFSENVIANNWIHGVYISEGYQNDFMGNIISSNDNNGIEFQETTHTSMFENIIMNNGKYGVYIPYSSVYDPSYSNSFYYNTFINNDDGQVYDGYSNSWYYWITEEGNYWNDFDEAGEGAFDSDSNGIVDSAYYLSDGSNFDPYPLMEPYNVELPVSNQDTGESFVTITHALDDLDTNNGDTILVESGTYFDFVEVDKSVTIIGENKDTTIINHGVLLENIFTVNADSVTITGFTIQDCYSSCLNIFGSYCTINDTIIQNNKDAIYLDNTVHNITISNSVIRDNSETGIILLGIDDNQIYNNNITGNKHGMFIGTTQAKNNTIYDNTFYGNTIYGLVILGQPRDNTIYHNAFINNGNNAVDDSEGNQWDNGYPSGGNYWDDYTGSDSYSGPLQDVSGSDGIGDTPHVIPIESYQDNYPLMEPWTGTSPVPPPSTVYADDDYDESTIGWGYNRYNTITDAIDSVATYGEVHIKSGTYQENLYINKRISLVGDDNPQTIILDGSTGDYGIRALNPEITIQGLTIVNCSNTAIRATYDYFTCTNNYIYNCSGGINLDTSHNSQVSQNIIENTDYALGCIFSTDNILYQNIVTGADTCVWMYDSNSNEFYENTFDTCNYSFYIYEDEETETNHIYHNNFINCQDVFDNRSDIWDNDYPSGGNYWSDYTGIDANSDGIGDTPYDIPPASNQDRYPLMNPYGSLVINLDTSEEFGSIQQAINDEDTLAGHTIYITNGTYAEHIIIDKSINLLGEDKTTTFLDGHNTGTIITINASSVIIEELTLQHSGTNETTTDSAIKINENGCNIEYCIFKYNLHGIYLKQVDVTTIQYNDFIDHGNSAIISYYSENTTIEHNNLYDGNYKGIYLYRSINNKIKQNDFNDTTCGIDCYGASSNQIYYNQFTNNGKCIYLHYDSEKNKIYQNDMISNSNGIDLAEDAHQNHITYNTIAYSSQSAIILDDGTRHNYISNNHLYENKNGIALLGATNNNTFQLNFINNSQDNGIYTSAAGAGDTTHNIIVANHLLANKRGLYLISTFNNRIFNNHIKQNIQNGIELLLGSQYNKLTGNHIFENNGYGIKIDSDDTINNLIYDNNLINNTQGNAYCKEDNFWNATYPGGGNYWSDYTGSDIYSGPNQNESGSDGYGDTPYNISGLNPPFHYQDHYPLIEPLKTIICGDANGDGMITTSDPSFILNYLFTNGPAPNPLCRADADGDDQILINDAIYLINYLLIPSSPVPVEDCCDPPW